MSRGNNLCFRICKWKVAIIIIGGILMCLLPASVAAPLISWELMVPELSKSCFLKISYMTKAPMC